MGSIPTSKRCLFCKKDSSKSISVEHIIPESLGNTTQVLPAGVVCDTCNNYFSRGVEKPFLESPEVRLLRFEQSVPSKRGKIPPATGVCNGQGATVWRDPDGTTHVALDPTAWRQILQEGKGILILPASNDTLPAGNVTSRFVAKIALEAMAQRLVEAAGGIEYLVDEPQLDPIRTHARYGATGVGWPVHTRRIYPADWDGHEHGTDKQIVHESDILATPWGEWFFVMAVFGLEMPSIMADQISMDTSDGWMRTAGRARCMRRNPRCRMRSTTPSLLPLGWLHNRDLVQCARLLVPRSFLHLAGFYASRIDPGLEINPRKPPAPCTPRKRPRARHELLQACSTHESNPKGTASCSVALQH